MDKLHNTLKDLGSALDTMAGKVTEKDIKATEQRLNIRFGSEMKEYLLRYGSVTYKSLELYGLGYPDGYFLDIEVATEELRELDLPEGYVPIYDAGDGFFAVVSENDEVYEWAHHEEKVGREIASSLSDFIVKLIKSVK